MLFGSKAKFQRNKKKQRLRQYFILLRASQIRLGRKNTDNTYTDTYTTVSPFNPLQRRSVIPNWEEA